MPNLSSSYHTFNVLKNVPKKLKICGDFETVEENAKKLLIKRLLASECRTFPLLWQKVFGKNGHFVVCIFFE